MIATTVRHLSSALWIVASLIILSACQAMPPASGTLSELDDAALTKDKKTPIFNRPKTKDEIRQAYSDYLNNAAVDEKNRIAALTRLAELEFNSSDEVIQNNNDLALSTNAPEQDKLYLLRLNKTIQLLSTSLNDYPDAKNNDSLLYQLAKAQAQVGKHSESIESLNRLVEKHLDSPFYAEAQFRIAEDAFAQQDYSSAEYAYNEVIISPGNDIFFEKSLFKRGWSRFKQQYYEEAIDDFFQAVLNHGFDEFEKLTTAEREQFDEYFRAIGLSFSYLGGPEKLHSYFKEQPDFKYTYFTYSMLADLYLKQERYSDAVQTLEQFITYFPDSDNIPYSHLKIIEVWKNSGFSRKIYAAIDTFYQKYNPASTYWKDQNENSRVNRAVRSALKEYVVLMTAYYHDLFQQTADKKDNVLAKKWYQRYFNHYTAYAQQDNIYYLYAELLTQNKNNSEAFKYYELAAYDNDLIINRSAALASLISSYQLIKKSPGDMVLIDKHIRYAIKYSQQYIEQKQAQKITLNAIELAFKNQHYQSAIELSDLLLAVKEFPSVSYVTSLKADAYFQLGEFGETEKLYKKLLNYPATSSTEVADFNNKLAIAIYKQGELAAKNQKIAEAVEHFTRISVVAADTDLAPTGLYDAIAIYMQNKQWDTAIEQIKHFQSLYPQHKYSTDVSKKLSVAYLGSNQGIKAAQEFERIAQQDNNIEIKTAALWQAAQLYLEKGNTSDAIRSFEEYVSKFKKPYNQLIEAMYKLSELNSDNRNNQQSSRWLKSIVEIDEKTLNNVKTDRTRFLVSSSYLTLARKQKTLFDQLKLTLPLKDSLARKKAALQNSAKFYGQAATNRIYDIVTESTYSIALIYMDFSQALLNSDRPSHLSDEALDQYEILLEDQAFPFEDKAIEFFEINLSRIKEGLYNDWIKSSYEQLIKLFPVRYDRQPRRDQYVAEMN